MVLLLEVVHFVMTLFSLFALVGRYVGTHIVSARCSDCMGVEGVRGAALSSVTVQCSAVACY